MEHGLQYFETIRGAGGKMALILSGVNHGKEAIVSTRIPRQFIENCMDFSGQNGGQS